MLSKEVEMWWPACILLWSSTVTGRGNKNNQESTMDGMPHFPLLGLSSQCPVSRLGKDLINSRLDCGGSVGGGLGEKQIADASQSVSP
jgi:hypothetical protein